MPAGALVVEVSAYGANVIFGFGIRVFVCSSVLFVAAVDGFIKCLRAICEYFTYMHTRLHIYIMYICIHTCSAFFSKK